MQGVCRRLPQWLGASHASLVRVTRQSAVEVRSGGVEVTKQRVPTQQNPELHDPLQEYSRHWEANISTSGFASQKAKSISSLASGPDPRRAMPMAADIASKVTIPTATTAPDAANKISSSNPPQGPDQIPIEKNNRASDARAPSEKKVSPYRRNKAEQNPETRRVIPRSFTLATTAKCEAPSNPRIVAFRYEAAPSTSAECKLETTQTKAAIRSQRTGFSSSKFMS